MVSVAVAACLPWRHLFWSCALFYFTFAPARTALAAAGSLTISFGARAADRSHLWTFLTVIFAHPPSPWAQQFQIQLVGRHLYCTLLQYHYFCEGSDITMLNWQTLTVSTKSVPLFPCVRVKAKGTTDGGRVICLHPHPKTSLLLSHNTNQGCSQHIKHKDLLLSKTSFFMCFIPLK